MSSLVIQLINFISDSPTQIGEIMIVPLQKVKKYRLFHQRNYSQISENLFENLKEVGTLIELDLIIRFDAFSQFRALKAEKNLVDGWVTKLLNPEELLLFLNHIYPSAIAFWSSHQKNQLKSTMLKDKVMRQSGRYKITQSAEEKEIEEVFENLCCKRCLRIPMWHSSEEKKSVFLSKKIPIFCREACTLFLSDLRKKIKKKS